MEPDSVVDMTGLMGLMVVAAALAARLWAAAAAAAKICTNKKMQNHKQHMVFHFQTVTEITFGFQISFIYCNI